MAVLLLSFVFGLQQPSLKLVLVIFSVSGGVALASYAEVSFVMVGFVVQSLGIFCEAARLVMIQLLIQGSSMSPMESLYHFAPVRNHSPIHNYTFKYKLWYGKVTAIGVLWVKSNTSTNERGNGTSLCHTRNIDH